MLGFKTSTLNSFITQMNIDPDECLITTNTTYEKSVGGMTATAFIFEPNIIGGTLYQLLPNLQYKKAITGYRDSTESTSMLQDRLHNLIARSDDWKVGPTNKSTPPTGWQLINVMLNELTDELGEVDEVIFGQGYIQIKFYRFDNLDLTLTQILNRFGLTDFQITPEYDGYYLNVPMYGQY